MAAESRLSADDIAALVPGDTVTVESSAEFGRRRYTCGTVARVTARHVVVRCGCYVECYRLQDGVRDGGTGRAELLPDPRTGMPRAAAYTADRRRVPGDAAYRDWSRHRTDLERLRQLHAAISQVIEEGRTPPS